MNDRLRTRIEGVAWWSEHLPSWEAARSAMRNETHVPQEIKHRPAPAMLAAAERRRAPDTVAIALEVAMQACTSARRSPPELNSVFASTHGDLAISDYLCATLATTPTLLSPTKFHHSVHNAAAGYWTIGVQTHRPYTALGAHHGTFAAGLLEAALQVVCDNQPVLYVAYDVEACGPMATGIASKHLFAVALILSSTTDAAFPSLELALHDASAPTSSRSAVAASIAGNALSNAVPFFEAIAMESSQAVDLYLSDDRTLTAKLAFRA